VIETVVRGNTPRAYGSKAPGQFPRFAFRAQATSNERSSDGGEVLARKGRFADYGNGLKQRLEDIQNATIDLMAAASADFPKQQTRGRVAAGGEQVMELLARRLLDFYAEKLALLIALDADGAGRGDQFAQAD
jgi:hypothetical protein